MVDHFSPEEVIKFVTIKLVDWVRRGAAGLVEPKWCVNAWLAAVDRPVRA